MTHLKFSKSSEIKRTARVAQLEGLFDIAPSPKSTVSYDIDLPIDTFDWNIGLIVGPSGCGKTSIASELFGENFNRQFTWERDKTIVDCLTSTTSSTT
jgi:ABC-type transport system involved in cytochrome bd biosynthesis fused ATPase/permease subunit